MPKLAAPALAKRQTRIEDAALRLFRRRGFHAVALRDICAEAKVSIGNVYNHYRSKEAIFESLLERLARDFRGPEQPLARFFARPRFPDDLEELGQAVGQMVERCEDYLVVILIDVVEFRGRHIGFHYADLVPRFRALLGPHFAAQRRAGKVGPGDPAVAFAAAYMQFFNYFMIERLFGVRRHFGLDDAAVIRELSRLFREGILPRGPRKKPRPRSAGKRASR